MSEPTPTKQFADYDRAGKADARPIPIWIAPFIAYPFAVPTRNPLTRGVSAAGSGNRCWRPLSARKCYAEIPWRD
jgi:hypothetical protein